ncbi:hypothetical protein ACFWB0_04720 [Rhodococcus sp. NPDC060086]|uniref:hypothetical protein n=1 Tax=Rhodococcus sp. NPDC060086 TaxID=3347055 RepID=UPI00365BD4B8
MARIGTLNDTKGHPRPRRTTDRCAERSEAGRRARDPEFDDNPTAGVDPPEVWVDAIVAVARDLRCFRYGRDVNPDRLMWELPVGHGDAVMIGWSGTTGISGFSLCDGTIRTDASFAKRRRGGRRTQHKPNSRVTTSCNGLRTEDIC